jgi:ADP-ribose pyrophosphatase YjhB (NUDIX family)
MAAIPPVRFLTSPARACDGRAASRYHRRAMSSAPELHDELLNVYDAQGRVIGQRRRREAKASGLAVGAVNALVCSPDGELLMQRRPEDKENGGRWDKSVGGHVSAGEDFDQTLVREAGEELFDDARTPHVRLAGTAAEFEALRTGPAIAHQVLLRRVGLQLNLRDVRLAPGGGVRNVLYHVALYTGITALRIEDFRAQASEITALRFFAPWEVDRLLLKGELAPNMAFLWLTQAHALLERATP